MHAGFVPESLLATSGGYVFLFTGVLPPSHIPPHAPRGTEEVCRRRGAFARKRAYSHGHNSRARNWETMANDTWGANPYTYSIVVRKRVLVTDTLKNTVPPPKRVLSQFQKANRGRRRAKTALMRGQSFSSGFPFRIAMLYGMLYGYGVATPPQVSYNEPDVGGGEVGRSGLLTEAHTWSRASNRLAFGRARSALGKLDSGVPLLSTGGMSFDMGGYAKTQKWTHTPSKAVRI